MTSAVKYKIDNLISLHSRDGYDTAALLTPDDLAEIRGRITELEAENARLAAFARQIIECAFNGHDADGGSIQSLAVHHGLLRQTKYDPKEHGPSFATPGDEWFVCVGAVAKAPVE